MIEILAIQAHPSCSQDGSDHQQPSHGTMTPSHSLALPRLGWVSQSCCCRCNPRVPSARGLEAWQGEDHSTFLVFLLFPEELVLPTVTRPAGPLGCPTVTILKSLPQGCVNVPMYLYLSEHLGHGENQLCPHCQGKASTASYSSPPSPPSPKKKIRALFTIATSE